MRIKIIGDRCNFTILLPNGLIINGFTVKIAHHYISKYTQLNISEEHLNQLCIQLKNAKHMLNGEPLVYVKSKEGEIVEIRL